MSFFGFCSTIYSDIFKQMKTLVDIPDGLNRYSRIVNVFFFRCSVRCQYQLKCYSIGMNWNIGLQIWARIKETTINNFESRYHRSVVGYTPEKSESVKQHSRISQASLIPSFGVTLHDYSLCQFFSIGSSFSGKHQKLKRNLGQTCIFLLLFCLFTFLYCILAGNA